MKNIAITGTSYNPLNCPCRDCKKRNANCHSACDKYKDWLEDLHKKERK